MGAVERLPLASDASNRRYERPVSHISGTTMAEMAGLVFDFYAPDTTSDAKATSIQVLALRDFHSENLIWLPDRVSSQRVGLLDFQDAIICHPAYDLVSLTKDARPDGSPELAESLLLQYIKNRAETRQLPRGSSGYCCSTKLAYSWYFRTNFPIFLMPAVGCDKRFRWLGQGRFLRLTQTQFGQVRTR